MSKIEELIDELEDFIAEECKFQIMSNINIIVNKERIESYIRELRLHIPEEVRRYQKIISNRDAILNNAHDEAQRIVDDATSRTRELLSEHEINQQAQMRADAIVEDAMAQAQEIMDQASGEADAMKMAAIQYTDDILGNVEKILKDAQDQANKHYGGLLESIRADLEVVSGNRAELKSDSETGSMNAGNSHTPQGPATVDII